MDRTEVLERIEPVLDTQVRRVDHNPRTRVAITPDAVIFRPGGGARTLEMTENGVRGMARYAGIPEGMGKNLRPDTFGRVATELLERKQRYILVVKDGRVVDFAKPGEYHPLNPERVLRSIETAIPGVDYHRVLVMPENSVSLEVIGDRRQPVRRGDLIQAGANIAFSPIGTIAPLVRSYVLQLSCTNGATHNTIIREFHFGGGGEGDDIWQWFRRSVRDAYQAMDRIVARYRQMTEDEIRPEDRALVLTAMLKEAGIVGAAAETVRAWAIENPPQTAYDVVNLITRASSHLLEAPHEVRRAQLAAATFTDEEQHHRICPTCRRER